MSIITDLFKKDLNKVSVADLKIMEGKKMNEIQKLEAELRKQKEELDAIRTAIREKQ
jgi:hypothetical protein